MLSTKKRFKFKEVTSSQPHMIWKDVPGIGRILHGNINQSDISSDVSGTQCAAACIVAIAYSQAVKMDDWKPESIDKVIEEGTRRHQQCEHKDASGFADVRNFLDHYKFQESSKQISLQEGTGLAAAMECQPNLKFLPMAKEVFDQFIERKEHFCFVFNSYTLAVILQHTNVYLFNSHGTGDDGNLVEGGKACCICMPSASASDIILRMMRKSFLPKGFPAFTVSSNFIFCCTGITVHTEVPTAAAVFSDFVQRSCAGKRHLYQPPAEISDGSDFDESKTPKMAKPRNKKCKLQRKKPKSIIEPLKVDDTVAQPLYAITTIPDYENLYSFLHPLVHDRIVASCISMDKIVNNALVIYRADAMKNPKDWYWRFDDLPFVSGAHGNYPSSNPKWRVMYFYLKAQDVNYRRREMVPVIGDVSDAYDWNALKSNQFPYIICHYEGTGDLSSVPHKCHGNSKATPDRSSNRKADEMILGTPGTPTGMRKSGNYQRKSSELIPEIKRRLKFGNTALQAYMSQKLVAQSFGPAGKNREPRNLNQVQNIKKQLKRESCFEDEEALLVHHSMLHSDYMPVYYRYKAYLHCLTRLPQLDHHFRQLLHTKTRICLNYDTTFQIGKRYASIFSFRHPFLSGMPAVPLRFLFHETKDEICHETLFMNLAETFPELVSLPSVLITDREASFKTERNRYFPNMAHMFCYLHIYRNIEDWCDRHGLRSQVEEYKGDVRSLLFSSSEEKFDSRLQSFMQNWSLQFRAYFSRFLYDDVTASARFKADEWGVFEPGSGVTNNASEGFNSKFRRWISSERYERGIYEIILLSYFLQVGMHSEVEGAFNGGTSEYKQANTDEQYRFEFLPTDEPIKEMNLLSIFNEGRVTNMVTEYKPKLTFMKSKAGQAAWIKLQAREKIRFDDNDCFVRGFDRRIFHVDHMRQSCTCLKPRCEHLIAVLDVIGKPLKKNATKLNLSTVAKLGRKPAAGGRKLSDKVRRRVRLKMSSSDLRKRLEATRAKHDRMKVLLRGEPAMVSSVEPAAKDKDEGGCLTHLEPELDKCPHILTELSTPIALAVQNNIEMTLEKASEISAEVVGEAAVDGNTRVDRVGEDAPLVQLNNFVPNGETHLRCLPRLSPRNANDIILTFGGRSLTLMEIKMLDDSPQRSEEATIKKLTRDYAKGSLSANVVDALLHVVTQDTDISVLSSAEVSVMLRPYRKSTHDPVIAELSLECLRSTGIILLPCLSAKLQWFLAIFDTERKTVCVFNPGGRVRDADVSLMNLTASLRRLQGFEDLRDAEPPEYSSRTGQVVNTGLLVCYYAHIVASGGTWTSSLEVNAVKDYFLKLMWASSEKK